MRRVVTLRLLAQQAAAGGERQGGNRAIFGTAREREVAHLAIGVESSERDRTDALGRAGEEGDRRAGAAAVEVRGEEDVAVVRHGRGEFGVVVNEPAGARRAVGRGVNLPTGLLGLVEEE